MNIWLAIEFWFIALLSTWMTATAIASLRNRAVCDEDMENMYEQVISAVRSGDLPRAILILEGEPGPLAAILSNILTESTKFTPKIRVSFRLTIESLKRRSQARSIPLRVVALIAPVAGILAYLAPFISLIAGTPPAWTHALWVFLLGIIVGIVSYLLMIIVERQERDTLENAAEYGKKLVNYLLGAESPLNSLRGQTFPPLK